MKKTLRFLAILLCVLFVLGAATAFMMSDPKPNAHLPQPAAWNEIDLKKIPSDYGRNGLFKSSVEIRQNGPATDGEVFYGQEIGISGNDQIDKIRIGVTDNLISRIEIWKGERLVNIREMGFVGKMTRGKAQELSVEFQDHTNAKNPGTSKIYMRYFSDSGFLGDIGALSMDLTPYGDVSGDKTVSLFVSAPENDKIGQIEFQHLKVWKNFRSFD